MNLKWIGVGVLGILIAGLSVALLVRPPIEDDPRFLVAANPAGKITAEFLGGSLTDSLFAGSESAGYRPQVIAGLQGDVIADRGGVAGGMVAAALEAVAVPSDSSLVVIELGSGDVWKTDAAVFEREYEALIDRVRSQAPNSALVCLGVWGDKAAASVYDKDIRVPCQRAGGLFLPLKDIFEAPGMRGVPGTPAFGGVADGFHPSDAGYAAIADVILSNLRTE